MRATLNLSSVAELEAVLNAFALRYARESDRRLPPLYKSGIRYRRETGEHWQNPWETFQTGYGDCEDLALYRVAELVREGRDRRARVAVIRTGPATLHALVRLGSGRLEDPSRALGMVNLGEVPTSSPADQVPPWPYQAPPPGSSPAMQPADPLALVASLYPGAGLVVQLLQNPVARKMLVKLAKKIKRFL